MAFLKGSIVAMELSRDSNIMKGTFPTQVISGVCERTHQTPMVHLPQPEEEWGGSKFWQLSTRRCARPWGMSKEGATGMSLCTGNTNGRNVATENDVPVTFAIFPLPPNKCTGRT